MVTAPTIIRVATLTTLASAVVAQFLQHTDATFPPLYFTVDSALLMATVLTLSLRRSESPALDVVRGAATIGVVVSGVIYATVIAPNSATGTWFAPWDDTLVRTSTVLMHGIGPFLAVADFLTHDYPAASTRKTMAWWCAWPMAYFVAVTSLAAVGVGHIPYPFLRPQTGGGILGVAGAMVALTTLVALLSYLLLHVQRKLRPIPA
jgi:hypothetical protein